MPPRMNIIETFLLNKDNVIREYVMNTIAAVATPPGSGGISIIRVSGLEALAIAGRVCPAFARKTPAPLTMVYGSFLRNGVPVDKGYCVYMPPQRSYTGEDTVEFHCHGGRIVTSMVLQAVLEAGCRVAAPGEFTRRAFLNGRIKLSAAEAVMDLINARTDGAAKIALRQLEGRLDGQIRGLEDNLLDIIARAEVTVDYPEEDIEELVSAELLTAVSAMVQRLNILLETAKEGQLYRKGVRIVLAGLPNAGKSSLLNALTGTDRAIVTSIPGTTRDIIEAEGELGGLPVTWVDTAGIRESVDEVERIGVDRAQKAMAEAQLVLLLLDGDRNLTKEDYALYESIREMPHLLAVAKVDKGRGLVSLDAFPGEKVYEVSSVTGEGIQALREGILNKLGKSDADPEDAVMSDARHIDAAGRARASLLRVINTLKEGFPPEIAVSDLREAWHSLGEITGDTADEAVIDRIFAKFCVGK